MTEDQACYLLITTISLGCTSVALAIWNTLENKKMARVRHTLEFIESYNSNSRIDRAYKFIRIVNILTEEEQSAELDKDENNRNDFLFLMNQFEILAIGLSRGIYDKKLVKRSFKDEMCDVYKNSEILVKCIRRKKSDDYAFYELEKLTIKTN